MRFSPRAARSGSSRVSRLGLSPRGLRAAQRLSSARLCRLAVRADVPTSTSEPTAPAHLARGSLRAVHTLIRRMPAAKKGGGKAKPSKAAVRPISSRLADDSQLKAEKKAKTAAKVRCAALLNARMLCWARCARSSLEFQAHS